MNGNCTSKRYRRQPARQTHLPDGFSLLEVMIVLTIMGVLISMAAPSFQRALEQSRADVAGANLRAIWSAERLYWLENHSFTDDLNQLESLGLLDPTVVSATTVYVYAVTTADSNSFTATATRTGSERWSGDFSVDQTGAFSGAIEATGEVSIQPGFQ
jgi:prepilin-type N-terminal cleavage/methylation domain-containing protein